MRAARIERLVDGDYLPFRLVVLPAYQPARNHKLRDLAAMYPPPLFRVNDLGEVDVVTHKA